jgi:hypothetical protein
MHDMTNPWTAHSAKSAVGWCTERMKDLVELIDIVLQINDQCGLPKLVCEC